MADTSIFTGGSQAPVSRADALAVLREQLGLGNSLTATEGSPTVSGIAAPRAAVAGGGRDRMSKPGFTPEVDRDAPLGSPPAAVKAIAAIAGAAIPGGGLIGAGVNVTEEDAVGKALGVGPSTGMINSAIDIAKAVFGGGPNVEARDEVGLTNRDVEVGGVPGPPAGGVVTRDTDRFGPPSREEKNSVVGAVFSRGGAETAKTAKAAEKQAQQSRGGLESSKGRGGGDGVGGGRGSGNEGQSSPGGRGGV